MLTLDTRNTHVSAVGHTHGLNLKEVLNHHQDAMAAIIQTTWANATVPGAWCKWLTLSQQPQLVQSILAYANTVKGQFEHLVVVGIGGSALGALAMVEALLPSYWNERTTEQRQGFPKVYFVDNVDADKLQALLDVLDLQKTLVNVITKSGTTAETMAGYLLLKQHLLQAVGAERLSHHLVMTTDPEKGILRQIVLEEGYTAFEVPDDVGGRFSVFSAVGLLPAALLGMDIQAMMRGINELMPMLQNPNIEHNMAAQGALIQYVYYQQGKRISILMPYSAKLAYVADWYVQLWAESLGKKVNLQGHVVHEGPTPLKAVGVTDQHAQVQLFNEGPFDKITTFIRLGNFHQSLTIPNLYPDLPDLSYLGNQTFEALLQAEADATRASLTRNQRPNLTITLPQLDAYHFAQLLYLLEVQTAFMGALLNVDTFNQPGVELGKQYTYALMNRPGFEQLKAEAGGEIPIVTA